MRRGDALPAWGCAAATAAAFLLTWPFAELGFSDDWSYAFTAKKLALTGHLAYNGWATAAIIPQAYWGALFIKLFGFSFTTLRFSTLPLAMAAAALCYLLGRRAGLKRGWAGFASLTISLGPMFLPLATSFMTDVPGLMFILLSLYGLIRCAEAPDWTGQLSWLAIGEAAALIGGMDRQVVWIVPLVIVPYLMLLRRRDFRFVTAAAVAWMILLAGSIATQLWFDAQPYAVLEPPLNRSLAAVIEQPWELFQTLVALWLTTALLALPALVPIAATALQRILFRASGPRGFAAIVVFALIGLFLVFNPHYLEMPWLGNTLTARGILGWVELSGDRPTVLSPGVCRIVGAIIWIITALCVADWASSWPHLFRNLPLAVRCMAIVAVAYVVALLSRMGRHLVFDRYTLPLAVFLAIVLLLRAQNALSKTHTPRLVWCAAAATLGIYVLFSVACTQEVLALARARVTALHLLSDAGIPPTAVDAGTEQTGWTQLEVTGHINNPDVRNPPDAYNARLPNAPNITPRFIVEGLRSTALRSMLVAQVEYFSLLPPFRREILIYRLP